jgi:signal transduction histidine kinase
LVALNANLAQQVASETAKNLEKERLLVQQARHAAMGEMIGNIAHQWRQPLSVLGLILQNVSLDFEDNLLNAEELKHYVADAMKSIHQMSSTIDDFRDFFRPNRTKECYKIVQAVGESLSLVSASLKNNNIDVQIKGPDDLEICGYRNEIAQVMLNLLSNAKDALVERKPNQPRIEIEMQGNMEKRMLAITVRDNAGGIPEEVAEKIFDPYFTTKGKGTGIGLYITKTIVEQHMGGTIFFRNHGEGAEFTITLPLALSQEVTQELP